MTRDTARKVGGAVGTIAGAAGSATAAFGGAEAGAALGMVAGPVGSILAGGLLGALFGGAAGCAAGSAVGERFDERVLDTYCHVQQAVRYLIPPRSLSLSVFLTHFSKDDKIHLVSSMAYVADTPWHGLGSYPAPHAPVWAVLQIISITYHFVEAMTVWPKSQPYDVVQRHSLWRYVVTIPCPKCNSPQTEALDRATKIGGAAGAIAGAAGGAAMTLAAAETGATIGMLAGPLGSALGGLTGAVIGALLGGSAGCAAGVALGETIDANVLDNYHCLNCDHTFGRLNTPA